MTIEFDPWASGTGFVDSYDAVIKDSHFEFDPEYNNGDTLVLKLEIQSPDEAVGREGNGHDFILLPCGPNWEVDPASKGATARHSSGQPKNFNGATAYSYFFESAKAIPELFEVLKSKGGGWTDAGIWKGLDLHFDRKVTGSFVPNGETEKREIRRVAVTEYNGGGNGDGGVSKSAGNTPAAEATATPTAPPDSIHDTPAAMPPKVKFELKKMAQAAASHDDFVEATLLWGGVEVDGTVQKVEGTPLEDWCMTEANYLALKG